MNSFVALPNMRIFAARRYTAPLTEALSVESMPILTSASTQYFERGSYSETNDTPEPDSDDMIWGD